jgi:hypothetical protein
MIENTYVRSCADNSDIRQLSPFSKSEHALDPFIRHSSANVADNKYLVAFQEKSFGDASSSRVQVAKAWEVNEN